MKTQIVYLEPHDDYNSVRDKLNWTQASRVIIVWPGRGRVLSRRFDLVMLRRYARANGTQIGLVTLDPDVLHHAEALHIPTFQSLEHQPERAWPARGELKISKPIGSGGLSSHHSVIRRTAKITPQMNILSRIASFSGGFLAILTLIILLFPQAAITIEPETMDIIETYSIDLDSEQSAIITNSPRLPTRQVRSVLDGRLRLPTTGSVTQPGQPANGEVTFTNLTDQGLPIPAGTTVRTLDPTAPYFLTLSPVYLDPQQGAQITVEVVASLPGPAGNVPAESVLAIDGSLGLSASVSNHDQFTGGSLDVRSAVSSADLLLIRLELTNILFDKAQQALLGLAQEGEYLLPGSIRVLETVEERLSSEIGDAADSLELSLIMEFEGQLYSLYQLHSYMNQVLTEDLLQGENVQPDTLKILEIADIVYGDADDGLGFDVTISAQAYVEINPSAIRKIVKGKNVSEALEDLNGEIPFEKIISVDISPAWFHRFPLLDMQINVRYPWGANP